MPERRIQAAAALLYLGGTFLVFRALGTWIPTWTGVTPDGLRMAFILTQALGLGIPCLIALAFRWKDAGLKPPRLRLLLPCLLLSAGLWVPFWAADALRARFDLLDPGKERVIQILLTPGWGGRAAVLLTLAAVPALFEELAFRGLLQPILSTAWGAVPGILATSSLFALFHWSPAQTVVQLALGCALGWMRHRTGSLWPSVLGHALHNGIAVEAMARWPGHFGDQPAMPPLSWVALGLVLSALSAQALRQRTAGR